MGICQSEEQRRSKAVDDQLLDAEKGSNEVFKLLLLGTGESGKSTVYKQLVCLYGPGFSREYRLNAVPSIHSQIIRIMKTMLAICEKQNYVISEELQKSKDYVKNLDENEGLNQEVAWHISSLWNDANVRKALIPQPVFLDDEKSDARPSSPSSESESKNANASAPLFHYFPDSTEYFMKQLHVLSDQNYVPSNADLFRVRIPTSGILETEFMIKGVRFQIVDVGGQRNERRKWINCFDGVKAVLYVVAISEYDQQLYEEGRVNRFRESLNVFEHIAKNDFPDKTIIIFMNKIDLFKEKIKKVSFSTYFPEYEGKDHDADEVIKYMQKRFTEAAGKNGQFDRKLYFQITCAIDNKAAKKIFDAVKETVITEHLRNNSLIV
jgi:GTPase SAR1 family protein